MYFTLSKLLPALIMPYMVLFWILLVSIFLLYRNRIKWVIGLVSITCIVLYFLSLPYFSALHLSKEMNKWNSYTLPNDTVDVAIVLGGFMSPDPLFGYEVEAAFDRLLVGIRLINEKKARFLLLSGGSAEKDTNTFKAEALLMRDFIREFSILPDSILLLESKSVNTFENAQFSKKLLSELQLSNRIYLVTSYNHQTRATQLFEQQGFEVLQVPIDIPIQKQWTSEFPFYLLPDMNSLKYWSSIYREWLGSVWYAVSGKQ